MILASIGWVLAGISRRRERISLQSAHLPHEAAAAAPDSFVSQPSSFPAIGEGCGTAFAALGSSTLYITATDSGKQCTDTPACTTSSADLQLSAAAARCARGDQRASTAAPSAEPAAAEEAAAAAVSHRQWPGVTVVLPVKGCRSHSLENWKSHLAMDYGEWMNL